VARILWVAFSWSLVLFSRLLFMYMVELFFWTVLMLELCFYVLLGVC